MITKEIADNFIVTLKKTPLYSRIKVINIEWYFGFISKRMLYKKARDIYDSVKTEDNVMRLIIPFKLKKPKKEKFKKCES